MSFGQPLLLENVEEVLDPILDPVLDKLVQKSGRGFKVVLADKECEYSDTFRMYMTSRLGNPHFSPELCAQVAVINVTVTMVDARCLEQRVIMCLCFPSAFRSGRSLPYPPPNPVGRA